MCILLLTLTLGNMIPKIIMLDPICTKLHWFEYALRTGHTLDTEITSLTICSIAIKYYFQMKMAFGQCVKIYSKFSVNTLIFTKTLPWYPNAIFCSVTDGTFKNVTDGTIVQTTDIAIAPNNIKL